MTCISGWLLDVYPDPGDHISLWLLGDDGKRYRLEQAFPVTFYMAGTKQRLQAASQYLRAHPLAPRLERTERRELFSDSLVPLLAVETDQPDQQMRLFYQILAAFPDLDYYDVDIPLPLRHAAVHNTFPLARCSLQIDPGYRIQELQVLNSPWELNPPAPPLRILRMETDVDPARRDPQMLLVHAGQHTYRLRLKPLRPALVNLRSILNRHDPDLLLTAGGDTWLMPYLLQACEQEHFPLPLNRDERRQPAHHAERSYFSYGQVVYRGRQVHLFGRWHIDSGNAMLWDSFELEGVLETARVTSLPVQTAARVSPGTGISAMQILTALRNGILAPWRKQQVETPKTALQMFASDQGGLVYQPVIGLHRDVAEIDFVSMYPGIMVHFNISPETVQACPPQAKDLERILPEQNQDGEPGGLVPKTLSPLLQKRLALKKHLLTCPAWDPQRKIDKARASAHKWLLVTCFGYLGYKNARFGRIEAHEAVTAYGREALMRAKETAEEMGFEILHMYVDGLWIRKKGASKVADFQPALEAIAQNTGLPISLDGVYRWVAFLPSRSDARVPVPNRYFGVFQDGSLKVRGIEARRGDTPPFIAQTQMEILEILAQNETPDIHKALSLVRRRLSALRKGKVALEHLVISQRLSRELDAYRVPSPSARAATQLAAVGKHLRPGQSVRFVHTLGYPDVHAWDLPETLEPARINIGRYMILLIRAAHSVLEPFGISEAYLKAQILDQPSHQLSLPPAPRPRSMLRKANRYAFLPEDNC
jgi:DNA polymerase-2